MKKIILSVAMLSAFATTQLSAETPLEQIHKFVTTPEFQQKASEAGSEMLCTFCKTSLAPLIAILISLS